MMYSWEEVKRAVERVEDARLEQGLAEAEAAEGHKMRRVYLLQRTRPPLEILGALLVGVHIAVMTLIFNFLLFVWLFHVNFDF